MIMAAFLLAGMIIDVIRLHSVTVIAADVVLTTLTLTLGWTSHQLVY